MDGLQERRNSSLVALWTILRGLAVPHRGLADGYERGATRASRFLHWCTGARLAEFLLLMGMHLLVLMLYS